MKILHIITSLELGGAEKLLTELLPAQIESGHTIELMILSDINAVFKKDLEDTLRLQLLLYDSLTDEILKPSLKLYLYLPVQVHL